MKNLRHKINNYESTISPDLFDTIMAQRNKKKRDYSAWFWALTVGILALLTLTIFYISGTNNEEIPNDTAIAAHLVESPTKSTASTPQPTLSQPTNSKLSTTSIHPTPPNKKNTKKTITTSLHKQQTADVNLDITKKHSLPLISFAEAALIPKAERTTTTPSFPLPMLLPKVLSTQKPVIKFSLPNNDCYTFNGRNRNGNSKLFIDLLGSPDYIKSNLTAKLSESQAYQKNRIASENYEFSYSGQFGIGIETGGGIVIRSGLNYSQYNSRFRKSDPNYKKVSIEQIFDQQGNLLRIDTITSIGTLDIQHYNTHKYIGIPLTLGYTTSGRKLDIGINIGAQFNIQTTSKGRFIGADLQTTEFTLYQNSNQSAYKTKIGAQGIANLTFAYEVGDHFDLIFAPHVKFTPKSITTDGYPLTEKLMTTGLWLGGRIRF